MKFRTWLKKQKGRDDPVGDLARDVCLDRAFPLMEDWRVYLNHMYAMGASDAAIEALERSWMEYWDRRMGVEYEAFRISRQVKES